MEGLWRRWRWLLLVIIVALLFLVLSGCTWHGVMGDGCVLCDFVPSARSSVQSQALAAPPVIRPSPAVRFNGSAMVSLDYSLRDLRGDIFQALQSACGITHAEAKDRYGWPTAPAHDYGVEAWVSTSWHEGIGTVRVSAMVSRATTAYQQGREYVFVKNGSGSATYGESYGAYGARRIGMYRSADAAMRFAAAAAIANLCGGTLSYSPRADVGDTAPQEVPTPCVPPDCVEQTISLYGTWGGPGINSHWPSRPAYAPPARHHHHHGFGKGFRGGRRGR